MRWRTAFVGREREIAAVRSLLAKTRLLTLTGAGGIGKTRLAVEAVRRKRGALPGEVVIVELASVRDPSQLLGAIGAAVGSRDTGAVDPLHALSERLGRGDVLLVLDNFEQIASAAPVVGELLDATASLRVVVTSRVALHLSGEQEYPIPPLQLPSGDAGDAAPDPDQLAAIESIALFVERARMVQPGFELTADNAPTIAEICRRLEGLPLAIELAASRLKVLGPEALLKRLGQRLALLTGGAADVPERQRTLRATVAWSYDLLPVPERDLLLHLAVFAGGFTIDAARAVSRASGEQDRILDQLGLLVDHNLVTAASAVEGEPRFGMLETIREFALDEMGAAEHHEVRRRHAEYYAGVAEEGASRLQGPEHARWLARLTDELDNFRAALAWLSDERDGDGLARLAGALATYWRYYGDIREGRRWLDVALARSRSAALPHRAKVTRSAGWLEAVAGNLTGGEALLKRALGLYEQVADEAEIATTLYHLGATQIDLRRAIASWRTLERGLVHARRAGAAATEARLLVGLAQLAGDLGRRAERATLVQSGMEAARKAGDLQRLALALNLAAWDAWDAGDQAQAIARWTDSVATLRDWGERAFLSSILEVLAWGHLHGGDRDAFRPLMLEALQLARQAGAVPDVISSVAHVADWFHAIGATDRALLHWRAAEQLRAAGGFRPDQCWPLPEVEKDLKADMHGASRPVPAHAGPVTLEQALDAAERDLQSYVVPVRAGAAASREQSPFELTPREREVLELVVAGRSNAEIGEALYISRKTASVHVANIKDKLGAESRIGIVTMALDRGLTRDVPRDGDSAKQRAR